MSALFLSGRRTRNMPLRTSACEDRCPRRSGVISYLSNSFLNFSIDLGLVRDWPGVGNDFVLLDAAHHVHYAFVNLTEIAFGQWTGVAALHISDHFALAIRFINGQAGIAFQSSNFDGRSRALVKQRRQFAVQFVDFLAPIGNVHRKAVGSQLSALCSVHRGLGNLQPKISHRHAVISELRAESWQLTAGL